MPIKVEEWKGLQADYKLRALIYSEPGAGKTTLANTLKCKKLWLDFDDGLLSLDADPSIIRVPSHQLTRHSDVLEAITYTYKEHKVDAVILDTITTLYRIEVEDYLKNSTKHAIATLAEYGPAAERTRQIMRYVLALPDVHVLMLAHRLAIKDEVLGKIMGGPNVPGKLMDDSPGMVDELYYLSKVPDAALKKDVTKICTSGDGLWPAKSRLGRMGIFEKYEKADLPYLIDKATKARVKPA